MSNFTMNSQQLRHIDIGINILSKKGKGPKTDPHIYSDWFRAKMPLQFNEERDFFFLNNDAGSIR